MAYLPAILIVLTLTGEPVANALCINWCDTPSERQHCSDVIAQPSSQTLLVAGSTCRALLTAGPFLREEGRRASFTAAAWEIGRAGLGVTEDGLVHVPVSGDTTRGRPLPMPVMRV